VSLGLGAHLAKKRKFAISEGRPMGDINVTPLVDVVLVLLIIFMVVTPLLEKDIQVRVPDKDQEEVTEPPTDQLVVSLDDKGGLKINSEVIEDSAYIDRMKRVLAAKPPEERLVFFIPDEKANYGRVVFALDGARTAGARILGVITEPVVGIVAGGGEPTPEGGAPTPAPAPAPEPPK
jgi:biopolymer transport protein TolR